MYRLIWVFAFVLLATPISAQDDAGGGLGGFGDFGGGLFGGDVFGGDPGTGNRGGQPDAAAVDRLATLRDMLAKANVPLTAQQETAIGAVLDVEGPAMQQAFRARAQEILAGQRGQFGGGQAAAAEGQQGQRQGQFGQRAGQQGQQGQQAGPAQQAPRGQQPPQGAQAQQGQQGQQGAQAPRGGGQFAGQRGGQGGQGGQGQAGTRGLAAGGAVPDALTDPNGPLMVEMRRMNDELLGKISALLRPDQQSVIKKWQNDQIRARGGLEALQLIMEEAGAPLTPEQIPQIQALYAQENQARAQLVLESPGQPDPERLSQLQLQTLTQVVRLLNADQRKALQDSMSRTRPQ